jgi:hypothetical protein
MRRKQIGSVFENRVPRRIFGPKKEKVEGRWIKLYKVVLRNFYTLRRKLSGLSNKGEREREREKWWCM